ncbi:MAG: hypothetical protein MUF15_01860 [Acidobacteria bacterium]|jgi:hypothetical protein|nr:hypothetical protein [Acidobacteriota bacterium]
MESITRLLKIIFLRLPRELFTAILYLLFASIIGPLSLLLAICEWLRRLWKTKNIFAEEKEEACKGLPEALIRRPDPCLYSQSLLMAQGLPVTWDNPDIWLARADQPGIVEPDSYHLLGNTDYIVSVQVHNASTDLALGVKVRLNYRPWSFNSPNLVPVETDAMGNEVFRFTNIMPMGASTVTFLWHTPAVATGFQHYCIQASVSHPLDTNTANNVGQENTNVYSNNPGHVEPGELLNIEIPLYNIYRQTEQIRFIAHRYQVNHVTAHQLQLKPSYGYASWPLSRRVANFVPVLRDITRETPTQIYQASERMTGEGEVKAESRSKFSLGQLRFSANRRLRAVKTRYTGFEEIRRTIISRDISLPAAMEIRVGGRELDTPLLMEAGEMRVVPFTIKIPGDIPRGSQLPVNIIATRTGGILAGGVTLLLKVKE